MRNIQFCNILPFVWFENDTQTMIGHRLMSQGISLEHVDCPSGNVPALHIIEAPCEDCCALEQHI